MIERPFWSDNFDLDLPKVVPGAKDAVGALADVLLWTSGNTTSGTLNHPDVWNSDIGTVAFFGFANPARPASYVSGSELISCTFWEAIRDAWPHHFLIVVEGQPIWNSGLLWPQFETILSFVRGNPTGDGHRADLARAAVQVSLCAAVERFRLLTIEFEERVQRVSASAASVPSRIASSPAPSL